MFIDGGIKKLWYDTLANYQGVPSPTTASLDAFLFEASDFPDEEEATAQQIDGINDQIGVKQVFALAVADLEGTDYNNLKGYADNKTRIVVAVRGRTTSGTDDEFVFGGHATPASAEGLRVRMVANRNLKYGSRPYALFTFETVGARGGDTAIIQQGTA